MYELDLELMRSLAEKNAPRHHQYFAFWGIPREFWNLTRKDIKTTPENHALFEFVKSWVDDIHGNIAVGRGVTIIGLPKSGKTMFGCAMLKSVYDLKNYEQPYKVWRCNYDDMLEELWHIRNNDEDGRKRDMVNYDVLFVDSITMTAPSSPFLSVLRTRRDYGKVTILATSLRINQIKDSRVEEILSVFADKNKQYVLEGKRC